MSSQTEIKPIVDDAKVDSRAPTKGRTAAEEEAVLKILKTIWSDPARYKNSCWGPLIFDFSLASKDGLFPMIRGSNFSDYTVDIPIDKFFAVVGNELPRPDNVSSTLLQIPIARYLEDISKFTNLIVTSNGGSLLAPRDTHILTACQTNVIKLVKGESTDFHVRVFNYQAWSKDACCLTVVVSAQGTSHYLMEESYTDLYYRDGDNAKQWTATGLADYRLSKGDENRSKNLTEEEEVLNAIWIYQIPLKFQKKPVVVATYYGDDDMDSPYDFVFRGIPSPGVVYEEPPIFRGDGGGLANFAEHAIIGFGDIVKPFKDEAITVSRDTQHPIRSTVCFYEGMYLKIRFLHIQILFFLFFVFLGTLTGKADKSLFPATAQRHAQVYKLADDAGSLVTEESERITEAVDLKPPTGLGKGAIPIQIAGGIFFGRVEKDNAEEIAQQDEDGYVNID